MAWLGNIPEELKGMTKQFLAAIQATSSIIEAHQIDPNLSCWSSEIPINGGFYLKNKQTYLLLLEDKNEWELLNMHWKR